MRYLILLLTIPIFSCSTYMENKIGQDFKSIQPDFTNIAPNNTFEGAVYSGGGGFLPLIEEQIMLGILLQLL